MATEPDNGTYENTLVGITGMAISLAIALICCAILVFAARWPVWGVALVLSVPVGAALVVSSLTIRIAYSRVCWNLGFGTFRRCVPIGEIVAARALRGTPMSWGYRTDGLRKAWIVSGRDFVSLTLRNGEVLNVNVNDPEAVLEALHAAGLPPS